MRYYLFILVLYFRLCSPGLSYAQINLVPNPSFEDTVYCPISLDHIDAAQHWQNYGNSPDYFHYCTGPAYYGLPLNYELGYQFARTGNAMAGLISYATPGIPNGVNYREFIGVELTSPLSMGLKYYFSFYINNANTNNIALASNKIGMNLFTVPFDSCCGPPLSNNSHLFTDSIFTDSIAWLKVSGSFLCDSAYTYLCIGNFFNDNNTDTLNISQYSLIAYYFIDDVCVTLDSSYNNNWTGFEHLDNFDIVIYPNPFSNNISITGLGKYDDISIYNSKGEKIQYNLIYGNPIVINLEVNSRSELFLIRIRYKDKLITKKMLYNLN